MTTMRIGFTNSGGSSAAARKGKKKKRTKKARPQNPNGDVVLGYNPVNIPSPPRPSGGSGGGTGGGGGGSTDGSTGGNSGGGEDTGGEALPAGKLVMYLKGSREQRLVLAYAPREVQYSGIGQRWEELPRDGNRTPLLIPTAKQLKRIAFTAFIGGPDWTGTVTPTLNSLKSMAESNTPVIIAWSTWEAGLYRITEYSVDSMLREPDTNEISRANVNLEFTECSDPQWISKKVHTPKKKKSGTKKRPKKYKVKKGDTLMKIAKRFYKSDKAWRRIAKANDIKNPKPGKGLKVGKVLKLP